MSPGRDLCPDSWNVMLVEEGTDVCIRRKSCAWDQETLYRATASFPSCGCAEAAEARRSPTALKGDLGAAIPIVVDGAGDNTEPERAERTLLLSLEGDGQ